MIVVNPFSWTMVPLHDRYIFYSYDFVEEYLFFFSYQYGAITGFNRI